MSRRKARETALQMSFQLDVGQNDWSMTELTLADSALEGAYKDFASQLVRGTWENRELIDALINEHSREWNVERLANVDRNILRIAIFELRFMPETEPNIVLNEAIELAKKYSTDDSGPFVNAVLDSIKKVISAGDGE